MENFRLGGIQQIGIGVADLEQTWGWYRRLGFDVPIFRDSGEAALMKQYTGGVVERRDAVLAINMEGGGGFEIWQFKSRSPCGPDFEPRLGDCGIFAPILRCNDIERAFERVHSARDGQGERSGQDKRSGKIERDPAGRRYFWIRDPGRLPLLFMEWSDRFSVTRAPSGGLCGALIGVSDMQRSLAFYRDLLGFDTLLYDVYDESRDNAASGRVRRVGLASSRPLCGPFSRFLGRATLELVEALDRTPRHIFERRLWGDLGFIHLCFEVCAMDALKDACKRQGYAMTIDSATGFDMGDTSGRFGYVEDPDGTLIEFVETYRLPLVRRLGLSIDLRRRSADKPLPDALLWLLRFARVRP